MAGGGGAGGGVSVVVGYRNTSMTESLLHIDVPVHVKLFPRIGYLLFFLVFCCFCFRC